MSYFFEHGTNLTKLDMSGMKFTSAVDKDVRIESLPALEDLNISKISCAS